MKHSILGYPLFSDKDISSYGGFLNSGDPKKWSIVIGCSIINHKPSILRSVPPFIEPPKNWIIAGQNSQLGKSRRNRAACPTLPWAQRPARLRLMEKLGICRIPETQLCITPCFSCWQTKISIVFELFWDYSTYNYLITWYFWGCCRSSRFFGTDDSRSL